jgi:uncharacterized protein
MAERIVVEVVYAAAGGAVRRQVELAVGSTVMQAVEASGIRAVLPESAVDPARLGIFSRRAAPDEVLRDGDRVEIYRPLTLDPKEARRRRAGKG